MDENRMTTTQHDQPARAHVQTREDTVSHASVGAVGAEPGGSIDPSTRRGLNRALGASVIRWATGGAIIGGALGLVLSIAPGPFATGVPVGTVLGAIVFAAAGAVIAFATGPLLTLEREDGIVEHQVEVATGSVTAPRPSHSEAWVTEDADDAARAENEGYPLGRQAPLDAAPGVRAYT